MDDETIVTLYWQRDEQAIAETERKYARYLHTIAYNILADREDSSECVNDTYLRAWNSMPPQKPAVLSLYLGKLTRRLSIDRFRRRHAEKRGSGEYARTLEELAECIPAEGTPEKETENEELARVLDAWLRTLSPDTRRAFLLRYYYSDPVERIAHCLGLGENAVRSRLFRAREDLCRCLLKEGITL